jgi:hypothetical protein
VSFQFERKNILTGSLNLLPPGDLIPPEDAISLKNWRVDQAGALRSRLQESAIADPNIGGLIHSIYLAATGTRFYGSGNDWKRGTSTLETGFSSAPLYMSYFQGFVWAMNAAKQRRCELAGASETWLPAAPLTKPTAAAGAAGVLTGSYRYYVTFLSDTEETNLSPASDPVDVTEQAVDLSNIPTSADARVQRRRLYRSGGALTGILQCGELGDNSTTVFTDNTNDEDVERLGVSLYPGDHDGPPAGRGLAGPYLGRLVAWKGSTIYWSALNQPQYWPGSAADDGNHAPVGDDGENILRVMLHRREARIYKERSIWRMTGDPDDLEGEVQPTHSEVGLAAERAICSAGAVDYFLAEDGIYAFNGDLAVKISGKLDPIFKRDPVYTYGGRLSSLDPAYRHNAVMAFHNGRLYFSYTPDGSQSHLNECTLVWEAATKRWTHHQRDFEGWAGGWTALYDEGTGGDLLAAASDGYVYALETIDALNYINLDYTSGYQDQGRKDRQKTYADVTIEHSVEAGTAQDLTVAAWFDDGATRVTLDSLWFLDPAPPESKRARTTFRINDGDGQLARNIAVHIDGEAHGGKEVVIYSIEYHFRFEPRDALTFDSGVIDLGYPGDKLLDLIEIEVASAGEIAWELETDIPGPGLGVAAYGTFAATGTQTLVRLPLDQVEARLARLRFTSTALFRAYGARIRKLEIPVRFDGGNDESFETPAQAA